MVSTHLCHTQASKSTTKVKKLCQLNVDFRSLNKMNGSNDFKINFLSSRLFVSLRKYIWLYVCAYVCTYVCMYVCTCALQWDSVPSPCSRYLPTYLPIACQVFLLQVNPISGDWLQNFFSTFFLSPFYISFNFIKMVFVYS